MSKILLTKLNEDLKLAGYAKRSRQSYVRAVRQLRNFWGCDLEDIKEQQVREYWLHCKDELDWMPATMRISYSGIKFFYEHTLKQDWETLKLLKIKQQVTPPTVLSIDEVRKLLANMPTQMNHAFYTAIYSLGLRLGEACFLQHVLPKGFMKIRHYGFMSPNFSIPIQKIREMICVLYELLRGCPVKVKRPKPPKPLSCPRCQSVMKWMMFIPPGAEVMP